MKAFVTCALIYHELVRLHTSIDRTVKRSVALQAKNYSVHGSSVTVIVLRHVGTVYLPPSSASQVLPIDAGVITSSYVRYFNGNNGRFNRSIHLQHSHISTI